MYDSNMKKDSGGEFVSEGERVFFPEQPCYHIEILEWIDEEDITDEWRYVWRYDPPEPVYAVTLGGFVEPLSRAFVYECIYTKSEYEQIKQTGFDYQTLSLDDPYPSQTALMISTTKKTNHGKLEV